MAQLGKLTHITAFDADNTDYPILGILCDPRAPGYKVPDDLTPHPDTQAWPKHVYYSSVFGDDDKSVQWLYGLFPGPWSTTTRQDWDGATVTVKTRRNIKADISVGETLANSVWTRNFYQQQNDDLIATEINEARAVPGNIITAKFYDSETDTMVSETRKLVAESTADPTITSLYVDFRREPIDSTLVTKFVTRTYPAGITSKTFTEFEPDHYTYPALLISVSSVTIYTLKGNGASRTTPNIESERPLLIAKRVVRTFTTTAPTDADLLSGIYHIRPQRNRFNGFFFNFETGPVLQDSSTLTFNTANYDPVWGPVVESYTLAASSPTRSEYLASRTAGEWKVVYRTSKKIANSLYMIQTVSIPIL